MIERRLGGLGGRREGGNFGVFGKERARSGDRRGGLLSLIRSSITGTNQSRLSSTGRAPRKTLSDVLCESASVEILDEG